jgi:hypothetical protein
MRCSPPPIITSSTKNISTGDNIASMQADDAHEIYDAWHPKPDLTRTGKHNPLVRIHSATPVICLRAHVADTPPGHAIPESDGASPDTASDHHCTLLCTLRGERIVRRGRNCRYNETGRFHHRAKLVKVRALSCGACPAKYHLTTSSGELGPTHPDIGSSVFLFAFDRVPRPTEQTVRNWYSICVDPDSLIADVGNCPPCLTAKITYGSREPV